MTWVKGLLARTRVVAVPAAAAAQEGGGGGGGPPGRSRPGPQGVGAGVPSMVRSMRSSEQGRGRQPSAPEASSVTPLRPRAGRKRAHDGGLGRPPRTQVPAAG